MASAEVSGGEVRRLGATSEWLVANTGHSRAQILDTAAKNLVSRLCDLISFYDTHLEQSPASELLLEAQEICVAIANHTETLPLIEALLQHCHRQRWEFPSSGPFPTGPVSPLSEQFLEKVTHLLRSGLVLSYESLVVLWTAYPPALHQELMDMAELCTSPSEKMFLTRINAHYLPKACAQSSQLFDSCQSFLREMTEKEVGKSLFLHLFNLTVTRKRLSPTQ